MNEIEKRSYRVKFVKIEIGKNLMLALQNGTEYAIDYCNSKTITNSISNTFGVKISRVSKKYRNPANSSIQFNSELIKKYSFEIEKGIELKPTVLKNGKYATFYMPISTNEMCLQCHSKEIAPCILAKINKLYSSDKAKGYSENKIRVLFKVSEIFINQ